MDTLILDIPFPAVLLRKSKGSIHGSTILSGGDEDDRETLRIWFTRALASPIHFHLEKPLADERQGLASRHFVDYQSAI